MVWKALNGVGWTAGEGVGRPIPVFGEMGDSVCRYIDGDRDMDGLVRASRRLFA